MNDLHKENNYLQQIIINLKKENQELKEQIKFFQLTNINHCEKKLNVIKIKRP
jgi:hypothetical protein